MRTMPVSEAGILIVVLSLCLTGTVMAQTEDEPMVSAAAYVSGATVSEDALWDDTLGGGSAWEMEWSDPRLPARMYIRHNGGGGYATHPAGEAMAMQMAMAVRLEGPDGDWTGTGWVLASVWGSETEPQQDWVELLALEGEGGYAGLSATLRSTGHGGVPGPYEGFIFESGLPPYPDPIELLAE